MKSPRPSGPNTIKGLRWERDVIREITQQLKADEIPYNNTPGNPRNECVRTILKICFYPKRAVINVDLIKAAIELIAYNDTVAYLFLEKVADYDYKEYLKKIKRNRKKDQ